LTAAPLNQTVRTVLLDIEGTTTPLNFVYNVLFPYVRSHAMQFLAKHRSSPEVLADIAALHQEYMVDLRGGLDPPTLGPDTQDSEIEPLVTYVEWLIERDRKSTGLKSLQGKIWEEGYKNGELQSQIFDDVPRAFKRWRKQGRKICIFSSGSVLAQKLLFAHTQTGDLTPHIHAYFDTTTGAKSDLASYLKIASLLEQAESDIAFISDVTTELDAGRSAGLATLLCRRPGNRPQPQKTHGLIQSFDEVFP